MVIFMFDFRRSMLMESIRQSMEVRVDQSCSVIYMDVGPLSSLVFGLCLIVVLVDESYLLLLRVSSLAVSCFSEMGGDWKRYLDEVVNQFVEVM